MPWRMQLKTPEYKDWVDIKPSGKNAKPYEYATKEEAEKMLGICYYEVVHGFHKDCYARVIEVE